MFKHPLALVESDCIGEGTRIWAFAHILPGAKIGRDCNICDHTFIENDVIVGDRVTIKCGVQLWDGTELHDDVFVGPNAAFTNDKFPRSRVATDILRTVVKSGASIGANATILPGLTIGENAMIGAGSVITHDVPQNAIVVGNPARIVGYTGTTSKQSSEAEQPGEECGAWPTAVRGVTLHRLPHVVDLRGHLTFAETCKEVPFEVKRCFLVFGVSSQYVRGEHAHRKLHQFMICAHGSCSVVADDGTAREEFTLDDPSVALYVPAMTWSVQYKYSADAVLLVLASEYYNPEDYIRSYSDFKSLIRSPA
jgi:acetyltransferase-like isoleucine patch superfamily enzyme/dTDP-4-dehydrorhamnose 3,5-epimerase-like enzyme